MGGEAALGLQGFGAGMSSVGAYYNAKGQKSTLKTQAYIDDLNANLADMSAQSALLSGQREEQSVRLNTSQIKAKQKTAFNANGIDANSDTVNRVLTTTDVLGEVDANTVAANALKTAFGYQSQATSFRNQAIGKRSSAKSINPIFSATTSLIGSAGKVADSWYKLDPAGAFAKGASSDYGPQNDRFAKNFGQHNLVSDALF